MIRALVCHNSEGVTEMIVYYSPSSAKPHSSYKLPNEYSLEKSTLQKCIFFSNLRERHTYMRCLRLV